jgi:hypothetical protein
MKASFVAKCGLLKRGAFVVTTTSALATARGGEVLEVVEEGRLVEDWGTARLFIQRRK